MSSPDAAQAASSSTFAAAKSMRVPCQNEGIKTHKPWSWLWPFSVLPELHYNPTGVCGRILQHCPRLFKPYHPTPWATNTHLQNSLGLLRAATIREQYKRQLLQSTDGGTVALDWFGGSEQANYAPPDTPVLLIIHGINGGSHEGYCKWACHAAIQHGWRAAVMNFRGCNGLTLTAPRGYNGLQTHDINIVVESIKRRFPHAPLLAAGYSMGSVLLTKYLAEADSGMHVPDCNALSRFSRFTPPPSQRPPQMAPEAPINTAYREDPVGYTAAHIAQHHVSEYGSGSSSTSSSDGEGGSALPEDKLAPMGATAGSSARASNAATADACCSSCAPASALAAQAGHTARLPPSPPSPPSPPPLLLGLSTSGITAAVMISNPICMHCTNVRLSKPWTPHFVYNLAVAFKLRRYIQEHRREIEAGSRLDVDSMLKSWTIRKLDDESIPKGSGYNTALDYYLDTSGINYIPLIRTPSLFLVSRDDPFLGLVPVQQCRDNPYTLLATTERGGHVAFLEGLWPLGPAWMDHILVEFMQAVVKVREQDAAVASATNNGSAGPPMQQATATPSAGSASTTRGPAARSKL